MYGMLLESVQHFTKLEHGNHIWEKILEETKIRHNVFNTHQIYPDNLMTDIAASLSKLLNISFDEVMKFFGRCFVRYFSNFGYDATIKATGRYLTDFLHSVDNIHMQFKFTYPKMASPSMYLEHEDETGVVIVYRSNRAGLSYYLMGQFGQIAKEFFNKECRITILESTEKATGGRNIMVKYRLDFDNREWFHSKNKFVEHPERKFLTSIPAEFLLQLFPFGILINSKMLIVGCGEKIMEVSTRESMLNQPIDNYFKVHRPKGIPFTWHTTLCLHSVLFELEMLRVGPTETTDSSSNEEKDEASDRKAAMDAVDRRGSQGLKNIILRGQMKYVKDVNCIVFLCSPLINDLDDLPHFGLYVNDLNHHGHSKEMVLAGWQHGSRLEMMFEKAEQRSEELEKSYEIIDQWKTRGDDLLYSMLPKAVAEVLRSGKSTLSTCESFDSVTILFCELVGFNSDTVQDAMQVVSCMNEIFTCFDEEMDKFDVYKVETVGQVYMAASGAPQRNNHHAVATCDAALSMTKAVKLLPLTSRMGVEIRTGVHTGAAVAGIVGQKVPRYCFFGDTVNTASRMQSTSNPGMVQISQFTSKSIPRKQYNIVPRGKVKVKGKGEMETFWLFEKAPEYDD